MNSFNAHILYHSWFVRCAINLILIYTTCIPQTRYPEEFSKRNADKLNYRYPGAAGESYLDVIERVRPVIIELERQRKSIVIVCHLAVLRFEKNSSQFCKIKNKK